MDKLNWIENNYLFKMGNTYGPCGGCGGIPVPVPYPVVNIWVI